MFRVSIRKDRGFSFVELFIVIAIFIVLTTMGTLAFINARKSSVLNAETDQMVSILEEARTNALAGKSGQSYGVKFNAASYVYFIGNTYDSSATTNRTYTAANDDQFTTTLPSSDTSVVFARITGLPNVTGTTTVSRISDPTKSQVIVIGSQGEITVIK